MTQRTAHCTLLPYPLHFTPALPSVPAGEESYESLMDSAIREDLQMHSSEALHSYIQAHHH